jgi:predicted porin
MKLNKIALAAGLVIAGAAHADVQLYGIVDLAVMTTNHGNIADGNSGSNLTPLYASAVTSSVGLPTTGLVNQTATAANTYATGKTEGRVTGLLNGGLSPSRWGIKGSEDLGTGLAAVFTLESGINAAAGTVPNGRVADAYSQANTNMASQEGSYDGQLFARESTVGLKSATWGEVRLGRQVTPMADALGQFDVNSGYDDPLVFNGGYAGGGFTAEARWDNSIKYTVAPNNMFKTTLMYRLPDTGSARQAVAGVAYVNLGDVRFAAFASKDNDAELASGATASTMTVANPVNSMANELKVTFADTKSAALMAAYDLNTTLTFKGGWERITTSAPSNPTYDNQMLGGSLNGVTVAQTNASAVIGTGSYAQARVQNMYWLGASYAVSPSIKVNGSYYDLKTNAYGTGSPSTAPSSTMSGSSEAKYYCFEVVDSMSKRTDVYALASYNTVAGPVYANAYPNYLSLGVGVRHNF